MTSMLRIVLAASLTTSLALTAVAEPVPLERKVHDSASERAVSC
jgi:hypothetical protein